MRMEEGGGGSESSAMLNFQKFEGSKLVSDPVIWVSI